MKNNQNRKLVILGSGGYGRTVYDIANQMGREIAAVLDDSIDKYPLDSYKEYISDDIEIIPAFGNNEFRMSWINKLTLAGVQLATLIHPSSYVSPKAIIDDGTVILPHAVVSTECQIGRGCIINIGALVDHGCVIEEGCHIAPGAIVKAENRIASCTKVDSGEVIEARKYPLH